MEENENIRKKKECGKQKYSKRYAKKIKQKLQVSMFSIAMVLLLIAGSKLAGLSIPIDNIKNIAKEKLTANESKTQEDVKPSKVTIAEDGAIVCDSIVQGVRDCELENGTYTFRVTGNINGTNETKDYKVELINYYDDVTYTANTSLGDSTTEYKMLVVKYHKNLTVNSGVYVTATTVSSLTYKKGMYLCVMGELKNYGTISMTARGTYNQAGENVYLWKNSDNSYEYVPAVGGAGGAGVTKSYSGSSDSHLHGNTGASGSHRQTGGGGSGGAAVQYSGTARSGNGGSGTSYSGGAGSGGVAVYRSNLTGSAGSSVGGSGSAGAVNNTKAWNVVGCGGAGNFGGTGYKAKYKVGLSAYSPASGSSGTGGLLVIYGGSISNYGILSSLGSNGGTKFENGIGSGGGSSGGGSINIFYNKKFLNSGSYSVSGGAAMTANNGATGGKGGTGSVTLTEIMPNLVYAMKDIRLNKNETYNIEKSKLSYVDFNKSQTDFVPMGEIEYKVLDEEIAKVNSNGEIIGIKEGKTKVEITDTANGVSTYIYVEVVNNVKIDVQEGKNFTIALKENGTVWSYGLNTNGQLGLGDNENRIEPIQIENLNNIKEISAGYSHSLALTKQGEVYAWGANINGQIGTGEESDSNLPIKIEGISNIIKIDAYKNKSIALSSDGKVYVWGEGYSSLPMRLVFAEKVVDISGDIILTEKGKVYNMANIGTPIAGLSNIAKISAGTNHNLALDVEGNAYSWGTNTYGECGTAVAGARGVAEVATKIYEISAGNCTSILESEDGSIYVLGNNANGQIGLGSTAKATGATRIALAENVKIASISAGEGTHSGLVDTNGFVWHTGLNTNGELGTGNNANKNIFTKTGNASINTGTKEKEYLNLGETLTINKRLENTFNLKIGLLDDNPDNFEIQLSDNEILDMEGNKFTAKAFGVVKLTVTHTITGQTKEIEIIVMPKMESIVQGFRDADLKDGEYEVYIQDQSYIVELINYYDDVRYSLEEGQTTRTVSLGDSSTEYKTLVVKYHGNLTIDKGVTLTATTVNNLTYKKGMYICVLGDTYNNGTISMTARGTYNQAGENVYLWKNIDDSIEYVPATGGAGGASQGTSRHNTVLNGKSGISGTGRQTGGGGTGAGRNWIKSVTIGAGGRGTSYSGGSGSGAANSDGSYGWAVTSGAGSSVGGAGGTGVVGSGNQSGYGQISIGGTGNPSGSYQTYREAAVNYVERRGTGGLLILYTNDLYNEGTISSNGISSSTAGLSRSYGRVDPGGASGGGSVNIFAHEVKNLNIITAAGGAATTQSSTGGAGGNGTVTINELGSVLNYVKKEIELKTQEEYQIDESKLWYIKLNEIQTEDLKLGNLIYETEDGSIATVSETGKIVGVGKGQTKIKITDQENGNSTYIIINVTEEGQKRAQLTAGKDYVVALKENGTVWTWGTNEEGQLGLGTNNNPDDVGAPFGGIPETRDTTVPVCVSTLTDIKQIEAGEKTAIALDEEGNVYAWGAGVTGIQKVEELQNIEKINSHKDKFYAIDKQGNAYILEANNIGENNNTDNIDSALIQKLETGIGIEDIQGEIYLGEDGRIYFIKEPQMPVQYLNGISKIEVGEDHYVFLTVEGRVYTIGKGELGQLGKENYIQGKTPNLVKTEEGYLENVTEIGAGNKTGMAVTKEGKAYVWGDNANGKIGIVGAKTNNVKEITEIQDKDGRKLSIKEMEMVEGGYNNTYIVDKEGNVYSVGINDKGQLGVGDKEGRKIFTQVGKIEIKSEPEDIKLAKGETKEISIIAKNGFNLKRDLLEGQELNIINTNENEIKIEKIVGIDNTGITNIKESKPNYRITGNKIGRVDIEATQGEYTGNIWINVVNEEKAEASAKVENGKGFTIALKADGTVWGWGANENGQLGLGNTENKTEPTQITLGIGNNQDTVGAGPVSARNTEKRSKKNRNNKRYLSRRITCNSPKQKRRNIHMGT